MKLLIEQSEMEILIGRNPDVPAPTGATMIYFTASWCGACRRLNMDMLESSLASVNWLKCDVDANNYTPGFCGVRAIPAFLLIRNGEILGQLQNNNTAEVIKWAQSLLAQ